MHIRCFSTPGSLERESSTHSLWICQYFNVRKLDYTCVHLPKFYGKLKFNGVHGSRSKPPLWTTKLPTKLDICWLTHLI